MTPKNLSLADVLLEHAFRPTEISKNMFLLKNTDIQSLHEEIETKPKTSLSNYLVPPLEN